MSNSSWDLDSNVGSSQSKKAHFTAFPEGITRIRLIDVAPYQRWTHWMPKYKRSVTCPGYECPICQLRKTQKANGEKQTFNMQRKFAMNIINRETGRIEIMDQGKEFFQDIKDLKEDIESQGYSINDFDLKVKRRGMDKDNTSYRIDFVSDKPSQLSEQELELIKNKIVFADYFKPQTPEMIRLLIEGKGTWEEIVVPKPEPKQSEADETIEVG